MLCVQTPTYKDANTPEQMHTHTWGTCGAKLKLIKWQTIALRGDIPRNHYQQLDQHGREEKVFISQLFVLCFALKC